MVFDASKPTFLDRLLYRLYRATDARAAWVMPDDETRKSVVVLMLVQASAAATLLLLRGLSSDGALFALLKAAAVVPALCVAFGYPVVSLVVGGLEHKARKECRSGRGEPWVHRSRVIALALLAANLPVWFFLVRERYRAGAFGVLGQL